MVLSLSFCINLSTSSTDTNVPHKRNSRKILSSTTTWPVSWVWSECIPGSCHWSHQLKSRTNFVSLLTGVCMSVAQLCLTLCNPIDCSLSGSSTHWILQARILEWVPIPFFRGSSRPSDWTQVSLIVHRFFADWATREAHPLKASITPSYAHLSACLPQQITCFSLIPQLGTQVLRIWSKDRISFFFLIFGISSNSLLWISSLKCWTDSLCSLPLALSRFFFF